jgi:acetyl-CoA carboxylase biotin carboxyl carrier protein
MGLTLSEIRRVVEAFDASDWEEIHISDGETELRLVAAGATPRPVSERPASEPLAATQAGVPARSVAAAPAASPPLPADRLEPGAIPILTPSMGVFYRAPSPGAPPFVEVGDVVDAATTVCIVEVMKLMNPIQAGVPGTVVGIHAANAERVVSGQTLFTIAPAG